jgi:hypothetical protein
MTHEQKKAIYEKQLESYREQNKKSARFFHLVKFAVSLYNM